MPRFSLVLLCVLMIGLVGAASPRSAEACSIPQDLLMARDTPANGVVIVDSACWGGGGPCFGAEIPAELTVVDLTTGLALSGSIVHSAGDLSGGHALIAWKPDASLMVGREYEVMRPAEAEHPWGSYDLVFQALPPVAFTAADVVVLPQLARREDMMWETISCESAWIDSCGTTTHEVPLATKHYASLEIGVDESETSDFAGQYVVTAALWSSAQMQPTQRVLHNYSYSQLAASERFDTAASAYCYRVEVTSLIDDSFVEYEDCIEHGTLGELTEQAVREESLTTSFATCKSAPEGYLQEWCAGRRAGCARGEAVDGCEMVELACVDFPVDGPPIDEMEPFVPGDPDPQDPNPEGPENPMDRDGYIPTDTSEPSDGDPAERMPADGEPTLRTACSVDAPGRHGSSFGAALVLLALALGLGRVRR